MTHAAEKQTDDATALLAYYDPRKVEDDQLWTIFMCTPADLAGVRESADYKQALSAETNGRTEQATSTDDLWDQIELKALGTLSETLEVSNDPRLLLGVAVQANKAARRRGGLQATQHNSHINVPTQAGKETIVRLRTRFVEALQDPDGARRLIDRQVEITTTSQSDLREDLTPGEVKTILRDHIGVNPDDIAIRKHQGPDAMAGALLDFQFIGDSQ